MRALWAWEARKLTVSPAGPTWFMIGVALNPVQPSADFAILTTSAGHDLRALVSIEPLVVPESKWAEFLDQGSTA